MKDNPNNVFALYLLGIAPKPEHLHHRYDLADMADIDLDFSPEGRDKIKEWLKGKFGEKNCVSIGTYGTLGVKGSVQEVSRAFSIKPFEYIKVSKLVSDDDKDLDVDEIKEKYPQVEQFLKKHPEVADTITKLTGMKKNIGQHAGGFIVSNENAYDGIPVVKANKGDVTGWQESGAIKELEALGWIKVDILGLTCVEQIRLCTEEVNRKYPGAIKGDPYLLPTDDPKVYDFINTLELENVFQMESKVFKEAVRKIKPRSLQDISNISTLVRPGAAEVDDYVKAKTKRREPQCLHHVYDHTRGLMIYQEQLMQVLMELGDFTIFDADKVRRLVRKIGKAKTSDENRDSMVKESEKYHKKYLKRATEKIAEEDGWPEKEAHDYAEAQWKQLMLQAKYAFNMPHSYAYSLMGYVQAYLKCYYPVEFWTATLNTIDRGLEKHGESSLGKYINSIQTAGINVVRPDINKSGIQFESENGKIYFALSYLKDVSKGAAEVIKYRPYENWDDFLEKAIKHKINKRIVKGLIFSGAVDFGDEMTARPYKWLIYLAEKSAKKNKAEIEEYQENMPEEYDLIRIEYDYCKYSFTGIETFLKKSKYKNLKTISERDPAKKLWVLVGYIADISTKKSKKSGNEYILITVTDFRDTISIFAFGSAFRSKILGVYQKGQLVKVGVKNDSNWLKLPWESEYQGKFPIEVLH
jgi:DNA polymerase-3 subunit alpha